MASIGARRSGSGGRRSRDDRCGRLTQWIDALREGTRVSLISRAMDIDLAALPDDVETLQEMVRSLAVERTALSEAQAEIERLKLIVQKLQRIQFGRRAERLDDGQLQLGLEDVAVDIAQAEARLPSVESTTSGKTEQPRLPAHLPREDIRLDVVRGHLLRQTKLSLVIHPAQAPVLHVFGFVPSVRDVLGTDAER